MLQNFAYDFETSSRHMDLEFPFTVKLNDSDRDLSPNSAQASLDAHVKWATIAVSNVSDLKQAEGILQIWYICTHTLCPQKPQ